MQGYQIILIGMALAHFWVDKLKWGSVKPFTCTSCMTGWFSMIVYLIVTPFSFHTFLVGMFFYAPIGNFVGSIYSQIQMRWL